MSAKYADEKHLQRALELARKGIGLAAPNPYVGAVIADAHGSVIGEATYTYSAVKHAEVLALEAAREKARGGTLYINLEPHAHQGRTPPCTDALIAAGIRRVVASMPDPNPRVSGLGFEKLRAAGVQVEVGQLQEQARRLNEGFARYIRHRIPFVTMKSAMTLDGKIAAAPNRTNSNLGAKGGSPGRWITGETARANVQELRHQNDVLLVGVGTILSDDPMLTDRSGKPRRRPLLRVILDSRLRLPIESRLVQGSSKDRDDLLVFSSFADQKKKAQLEGLGVRIEQIPAIKPEGRPDLSAVLRRLGELEIASVMIEGGATVNATALSMNLVDKIFFYYAPTILGDVGSVPFATDAVSHPSRTQIRLKRIQLHRFGEDFAVEGYLHDPFEE